MLCGGSSLFHYAFFNALVISDPAVLICECRNTGVGVQKQKGVKLRRGLQSVFLHRAGLQCVDVKPLQTLFSERVGVRTGCLSFLPTSALAMVVKEPPDIRARSTTRSSSQYYTNVHTPTHTHTHTHTHILTDTHT